MFRSPFQYKGLLMTCIRRPFPNQWDPNTQERRRFRYSHSFDPIVLILSCWCTPHLKASALARLVETKSGNVWVDHGQVERRVGLVGVRDTDEHGAVDHTVALVNLGL